MKSGKTLQELAIELSRQAKAKADYLVDTRALTMHHDGNSTRLSMSTGVRADGLAGVTDLGINKIAHRQIGQHFGIPAKYYDRMHETLPDLLAENVNAWMQREPSTRMVRTLDGTARAFLSDRYRRIDNLEVAQAALPILSDIEGARVESAEVTDSRMYIKVVNPRIEAEVRKGDPVQAGIVIMNSETGQGSVAVMPMVYRLVCLNGMIAPDAGIRKYHVGRVNEAGDDFGIYRNETIEADDRAFLMKIEDTVRAALDDVHFGRIIDKMREATGAELAPKAAPQAVELAAKDYGFTQDEADGILGHLIAGGDLSLYGMASAVTRQAQDVESYDRATELEAAGWKLLNMDRATWGKISK